MLMYSKVRVGMIHIDNENSIPPLGKGELQLEYDRLEDKYFDLRIQAVKQRQEINRQMSELLHTMDILDREIG